MSLTLNLKPKTMRSVGVVLIGLGLMMIALGGTLGTIALMNRNDAVTPQLPGVMRWFDVTVIAPNNGDFVVYRDTRYTCSSCAEPVPALHVRRPNDRESGVSIHALTGEIVANWETTQPLHNDLAAILGTVRVSALDPERAPWPYNGDPPPSQRRDVLGHFVINPHPASGIFIDTAFGPCGWNQDCSLAFITNGQWIVPIDLSTGEPDFKGVPIADADRRAVERVLDTWDSS